MPQDDYSLDELKKIASTSARIQGAKVTTCSVCKKPRVNKSDEAVCEVRPPVVKEQPDINDLFTMKAAPRRDIKWICVECLDHPPMDRTLIKKFFKEVQIIENIPTEKTE